MEGSLSFSIIIHRKKGERKKQKLPKLYNIQNDKQAAVAFTSRVQKQVQPNSKCAKKWKVPREP